MSPRASGLVGEWVAPASLGSRDTTLLRFAEDGTASELRVRPGAPVGEVPFGPFQVYADTGRTELVCFAYRRGRERPSCRYFAVDTVTAASGRPRRQLRLLNWVNEKPNGSEIWTERTP